jgi:isopenicillin N synthase-like dioxygenase
MGKSKIVSPDSLVYIDYSKIELEKIRQSLETQGFLAIKNHNVSMDLLDKCYKHSEFFFNLPLSEKEKFNFRKIDQKNFSNVGYFPYKTEKAVGFEKPDLKEFYHIGNDFRKIESLQNLFAVNVFPEICEFKKDFEQLFNQFQVLGEKLLASIWNAFNYPEEYIIDLINNGNSVLRTIHYPIVEENNNAMRAAPHTGIQLLGIQPRTTNGGLEFFTPKNEWITIEDKNPDYLLINIGDMLEYLLDNHIKSTLHRVINSSNDSHLEHRYCIVHFYHSNSLKPLIKRGDLEFDNKPVKSGEWLVNRLKEIGSFK